MRHNGNRSPWRQMVVALMVMVATAWQTQAQWVDAMCGESREAMCGEGWRLAFEDNFDGDELDQKKWSIYNGVPRDYEFRLQKAWHGAENVSVADGTLRITARHDMPGRKEYWSPDGTAASSFEYSTGEIWSQQMFGYGKYEARIKIPKGVGLWPAFWLYGDGSDDEEIDIFEFWNEGRRPRLSRLAKRHHMTVHFDWDSTHNGAEHASYAYKGKDFSQDFHIYTLIYTEACITWLVDGEVVAEHHRYRDAAGQFQDCAVWAGSVYRQNRLFPYRPMHIVLNLAIQSGKRDAPTERTPFPSTMEVDWVRYYTMETE